MARVVVYAAAAVVAAALSVAATATRPDDGDAAATLDGAAFFTAKGCATCHDGPRSTSMIDAGPSLADAPAWAGRRVDGVSAEEYLEQSMRSPSAFISPDRPSGGPDMPLLQLSEREIAALVDYLLAR